MAKRVSLEEARAARRPVPRLKVTGQVISPTEDAETLAQAQLLEAQRKAEAHPIRQECIALGNQLAALGVQWGFGVAENVGEMKPSVFADALAQILIAKGVFTEDEWADVMWTVLRDKTAAILEAIRAQRKSGLILPGQPQVPQDLMPGLPPGRNHD